MRHADSLPRVGALAALWLVVFGLCAFSALFFSGGVGITPIWPANAVVLAFVLRACRGPREAGIAIAVAFTAMTALNLAIGRPLIFALAFPVANVVEIGLAAWFMRRVTMPLSGMRDLGQFLLGGVTAGPLASGLIAMGVMAFGQGVQGQALLDNTTDWLLADMLGMAIVAPFALSMTGVPRRDLVRALATPTAVGLLAFALSFQPYVPVVFAAFPLVALVVLRDPDWGGALGVAAVAIAVIAAAAVGEGPVVRFMAYQLDPSLVVQGFLGALVLTAYPLSATLRMLELHRQELDARRALAESASAAKSELMGRVGEDIRSPLTGVVTVADILRSGRMGDLNPRQLELLTRIAESGAEIEALSREMSAMARGAPAQTGGSIVDTLQVIAGSARYQAERAGTTVDLRIEAADAESPLMPGALERIVADGLRGALAASSSGGRVVVLFRAAADGGREIVIEDADTQRLMARRTAFDEACLNPSAGGVGSHCADLRAAGGDLTFATGTDGGGRLVIILPRSAAANDIAAA